MPNRIWLTPSVAGANSFHTSPSANNPSATIASVSSVAARYCSWVLSNAPWEIDSAAAVFNVWLRQ
jgi:hypothetical protein